MTITYKDILIKDLFDANQRIRFLEADKRVNDRVSKKLHTTLQELYAVGNIATAQRERIAELESELRFYNGLVMGEGDHDKTMLARDGDIFIRLMKLLGMDVSGSDVQEIIDRVEEVRAENRKLIDMLEEADSLGKLIKARSFARQKVNILLAEGKE